jgi:hypothetical protein
MNMCPFILNTYTEIIYVYSFHSGCLWLWSGWTGKVKLRTGRKGTLTLPMKFAFFLKEGKTFKKKKYDRHLVSSSG